MKLSVQNTTCSHCINTVTRVLKAVDPHAHVEVDLAAATVLIEGHVDVSQAIAALEVEGYPALAHDSGQTPPAAACCGSCHS